MNNQHKQVKLTLTRSTIGALRAHKASVAGLGLRRMHHSVVVNDTPCNRGMINAVKHLVTIEEIQ